MDEKQEPFMLYFQIDRDRLIVVVAVLKADRLLWVLLILTSDREEFWAHNMYLILTENTAQQFHLPHFKEGKMLLFCQENWSIYLMQHSLSAFLYSSPHSISLQDVCRGFRSLEVNMSGPIQGLFFLPSIFFFK